ncbi:FGGY-family carbohydrate kinase [Leptolyngbya sp. FACHB-36]|uniref:FGGY-family carbohydrate kinase n=1 Tax=Leptolyngbya sp. FACHB-36 TaxID=2692808 RepID=UPI0016812564|nr:FGGY-family carbohydrate kinase [Leptolyngbya sp. FACHB-36]MBD2022491.1 FGGY-family carbohydrate kinase [Leptolyngbya sp. FACHB-36]
MSSYLGIDFGTSGARAIAIDDTEQIRAQTSCRFTEAPDQAAMWHETLFTLIEQIPAACRADVRSIAINGTSSTVLLCDERGEPISPPLLYNDARGAVELEALRQQLQDADTPERAIVLSATSSLVKLLWWSRQVGFDRARYLLHQADWLSFLLHGQLGISDYHNCLKLGYDVRHLCYPGWLREMPIFSRLPTVLAPGTPIAPVQSAIAQRFGLPTDCRVCAGTTDSIAAFLASGATTPGEAVTSLGSTLVLKLLSRTPVDRAEYGIYSHRLGEQWLVGGASNTGGAVLQQFFTPAELQQISAHVPVDHPSPLDYYPLAQPGERFPISDPQLAPRLQPRPENPVEFLHGLLESMARIEAEGYQLLQDLGATPLAQVYTAGGGADNPAWTAIRARRLGASVARSPQTEAAYGTARLAKWYG